MAIKNIVFDVGSVLMDYRWKELVGEYTSDPEEVERIYAALNDNLQGKWSLYDKGLLTIEEVVKAFQEGHPKEAEGIAYVFAHPTRMLKPRPAIWERAFQLKEHGYKIYLLTNYAKDLLDIHLEQTPILSFIDGMVASWEVHALKPDPVMYQTLLERYHLKAEECVFFDDRLDNVKGAVACGMSAIQVVDESQFLADMDIFLR